MLRFTAMDDRLTRPYDPKATEPRVYEKWEKAGAFEPKGAGEPFCIIMPPVNANGSLHAGHGLVLTIEDIMVRFARMRGKRTLWLPGLDHAGFETQVVYEKKLEKEGRSRFSIKPRELYDEIMAFTLANKGVIEDQTRRLGASCDWTREKFTLDADIRAVVYDTFRRLADDGLVYRGTRIVNWCPKHQTAFSDLEVEHVERADPLYYIQYGPLTIATVRPETKFGDTAVAVHPDDDRYRRYIGTEIEFETLLGKAKLRVIADEAVDPAFGTGVVKVTPAHDPNDFEMGLRHELEVRGVIDEYGKLNERTGPYAGMKILEARAKVAEDLARAGLLEKTDEGYKHTVATCYKCGTTLEPRVMPQWFVKMQPLAEPAIRAIERGEIEFTPEHYKKISLHWLSNIRDWNISRQIVWGIPIPAKLCTNCDHAMVDIEETITSCAKCGGSVIPDPDTFDTWFSSGQWPFAALGYPDSSDYKTFYPTQVMETAGEIIFFWVNRMIMLGLYATGKIPFRTVYLHGLVLDAHGRKMSKSKGNVINPIDLIDRYGTDAFRMALIVGNTPGTSLALAEDKINGYKKFANKLWNIGRFVYENTRDAASGGAAEAAGDDKKRFDEFKALAAEVTTDMESFRFYLAAEKLYHYIWHTFADVLIEERKARLKAGDESAAFTVRSIFTDSLKLLHPFMPFITEELWGILPRAEGRAELLIIAPWPRK